MNKIELLFKRPGINTLIQDGGRSGYQSFGVPVGGFLDKDSAHTANWLVGNDLDAALFEITISGPTISVNGSCQVAITGADMSPLVNDHPVSMYETINIDSNSTISFGRLVSGCRSYLAFGGTILAQEWLNSKSAASFDADSLTPDSQIKRDSTTYLVPANQIKERRFTRPSEIVDNLAVSFLPGPEYNRFSGQQIQSFLQQKFTIGNNSNRMGYRLNEGITNYAAQDEVISSPIVPGTVQITNSSHPIILLADAQTSGGYPRIANINSADLSRIAQLKPGDTISFEPITLKEAVIKEKEHRLNFS